MPPSPLLTFLSRPLTLGALGALIACGPAAEPRPATAPGAHADCGTTPAPAPTSKIAISLDVLLTPRPAASGAGPILSVDLTVKGEAASLRELRSLRVTHMAREALRGLTIADASGALTADVAQDGAGIRVALPRPVVAPLRVTYEVATSASADAATSSVVVADDRFRAFGEEILLLPEAVLQTPVAIELRIDGAAIQAPTVASSFGAAASGAPLRRVAHGRALVRSAFMAGSLGRASFDSVVERDEAAWLGYTAFDPRPVAAEIALVRSALREMWKGGGDEAFAILLLSSARPVGTFTIAPRASSLVVHVGPGEGWGPPLRIGATQHLMNAWIGRELRLLPRADGDASVSEVETAWFHDGFARFLAAHVLADLDLLSPDDARAFVSGLLSVQATSSFRGKPSAEVASAARTDARARADLVARGALHALRVSSLLRAKSKGTRELRDVLRGLLVAGRKEPATLTVEAWSEILAKELGPEEPKAFAASVLGGADVPLPAGALGPCFRAQTGDYLAFDLGFDARATVERTPPTIAALDPKGPAAAAGLEATDVLVDASFSEARPDQPVKLVVMRGDPANAKRVEILYKAAGVRRKGLVWARAPGVRDEACGRVL